MWGWAVLLADVVDGNDVEMGAEATHSLGFAADTGQAGCVQPLGLDQAEGHVAVQASVVRQVGPLLAALAQEALDLVAADGERGGWCGGGRRCWRRGLG